MAKTIKGLTVEIDGNTTKLSKALDNVAKESKDISSELFQVNKQLKFDPKDTVLLGQKQQLLAKAVENTKEKLNILEKAQESVNEQFRKGDIGEEEYRAFQREVIKTKSQLNNFEKELKETNATMKKLGKNTKESKVDIKALGYGIGELGDKLSAVSGKVMDFGRSTIDAFREVGKSTAQLEVTADRNNLSLEAMQTNLRKMVGITGELDSSTEAINNLMNSGADADQVTEAINQFAGAVTMFPDTLKFESLADSLQESIKTGGMTGQFSELLERLGYNIDDVNEKFGGLTSEQDRMNYALQLLKDQGLAGVGDEFIELNQAMYDNNVATYDLKQEMAELGELIMPLLNELINFAKDAVSWFTELDSTWQIVIGVILGLIAVLGPLLSVLGPLIIMAGSLNVAMLPMIGTIALIVAAVAAVVTAGVLLYKNWDKVKTKMIEIGTSIKNFFTGLPGELMQIGKNIIDGLVNGIKSKVSAVTNAVKDVTSKITGKIKDILQIRSPSRVMMQLGEFTGEGLALGIEDTVSRVEEATKSLASRVSSTMGNTKLGNNTVVNNQTISPNMDVVVAVDGKAIARQTVRYTAEEMQKLSNRTNMGRGLSFV